MRASSRRRANVHHIAVATPCFDDAVAAQAQRGNNLVISGTFSGAKVAYLPTERDLGVIIEILSGSPNAEEA